jgi:hypothetical protein
MNNVFVECPKRILFSRLEDNQSDGNLFDQRNDAVSLCIEYPEPQALVNLSAWQRYYGLDKNSSQAKIDADFDHETLVLTLMVDGEMPDFKSVEELYGKEAISPGPVEIKSGRHEYKFKDKD